MKTKLLLSTLLLWSAIVSLGQPVWNYTNLSEPKSAMGTVSLGSKAIFAGGSNVTGYLSLVEVYDVNTGLWDSLGHLSVPRGYSRGVVCGSKILFAGGNNANVTTTDVVDIYHFSTNSWEVKHLSQARSHAMITTVGNKVIIAGGVTSSNNPTNRVDIYDVSSDTWDTASLSFPRSLYGGFAATVKGKAYFAGGGVFQGNGFKWPSEVIDIYDPIDNSWSTDHLSEPLLDHSVLGIGALLVVAGGENDQGDFVSTVEILDVGIGISKKNKDDETLNIYPNPGTDIIHLDLSDRYNNKAVLANIYNLQGQLVFSNALEPAIRVLNLDLPAGVFILKVITEDAIYTELITIQ